MNFAICRIQRATCNFMCNLQVAVNAERGHFNCNFATSPFRGSCKLQVTCKKLQIGNGHGKRKFLRIRAKGKSMRIGRSHG